MNNGETPGPGAGAGTAGDSPAARVIEYHQRTKHGFQRMARSLGYLDWDAQPNPFRFFEGLKALRLPLRQEDPKARHMDLYERSRNGTQPVALPSVAAFLELSMGLSAWKSYQGGTWSLRMNPSSGNLHPTELHLILPPLDGRQAMVAHYSPFLHGLEPRAAVPRALWAELEAHFGGPCLLLGLTSIYWREAWKYGERAFRYCNHDVGHALGALSFSANLLGWRVRVLEALSHADMAAMFGLSKTAWPGLEEEHPDLVAAVLPAGSAPAGVDLPEGFASRLGDLEFEGAPNLLSTDHVNWDTIGSVSAATEKPETEPRAARLPARPFLPDPDPAGALTAARVIRQRRSAQAFDGRTPMARDTFLAVLDKTLPRESHAPFDALPVEPRAHLLLFVHRVTGLAPGLYFLVRNEADLPDLKRLSRPDFAWEAVMPGFPLYLLAQADLGKEAALLSCTQDIARDSAFSLGMVCRFLDPVRTAPHAYRELFWETGIIGQVLYLEAEAHGARGTGIGCFFDDGVHQLLGLRDNTFQSLYHFTVGTPVEDQRILTLPPYHHLREQER